MSAIVTQLSFQLETELVPQAIFWRPIVYFGPTPRHSVDDLDAFSGLSFTIGNDTQFEIRTYHGHPRHTTTVYLPFEIREFERVAAVLDEIIQGLSLPICAVAWRRGEAFEGGSLRRRNDDYLREPEARIIALKIASQCPKGSASTAFIKTETPRYFEPSTRDLIPSPSRRNERKWQQIIGNVISHVSTRAGPFALGYANRTEDGLEVTSNGLDYLKSIGFSTDSSLE